MLQPKGPTMLMNELSKFSTQRGLWARGFVVLLSVVYNILILIDMLVD